MPKKVCKSSNVQGLLAIVSKIAVSILPLYYSIFDRLSGEAIISTFGNFQ